MLKILKIPAIPLIFYMFKTKKHAGIVCFSKKILPFTGISEKKACLYLNAALTFGHVIFFVTVQQG